MRALTLNRVRDHFRRRRGEDPLDDDRPIASDDDGPDGLLEQDERRVAVREAILGLPEHQQVIVTMHYLEGQSVQQIMDAVGLPKGTVVSRLSRGRENLRRRLAPYIDAPGER